jgi:hypothetical protein
VVEEDTGMDGLHEGAVVPVCMDHGQCDMAVGNGSEAADSRLAAVEDKKLVEDDEEPFLVAEDIFRSRKATSWAASRVSNVFLFHVGR